MAHGRDEPQFPLTRPSVWLVMVLTGVVMGYSARIAFGCNVGGYFSGIRFRNKLFNTSIDSAAKNASTNGVVLPTRIRVSTTAAIMLVLLLWIDSRNAEPINPFAAPWPTALGSGEVPEGAHGTNL